MLIPVHIQHSLISYFGGKLEISRIRGSGGLPTGNSKDISAIGGCEASS